MSREPSITSLEREEEHARRRLAGYQARVNKGAVASVQGAKQRLDQLQRAHKMAVDRLRRARGDR